MNENLCLIRHSIIAVHGLGSNAKYAWSQKTGSRFVNWLADDDMLPSTLSHFNPRILLYSYDSKWHQDAPIVRLQECGTELFRALHDFRSRKSGSQHRPILFIGHSLGGNVIINVSATLAAVVLRKFGLVAPPANKIEGTREPPKWGPEIFD